MQKSQNSFRERIVIYSFILTVLVIWIHAVDPELIVPGSLTVLDDSMPAKIQGLLGSGLGQIAVPGFFCMSGYLFFRSFRNAGNKLPDDQSARSNNALIGEFGRKLSGRVRTLLLPYVLWNLIYFVIYLIAGRTDFSLYSVLDAVINYRFNPVFWYLKQLILITVITPVIYLFLCRKQISVPALTAVFFSAVYYDRLPVFFQIINEDALFYYMTGALLALHFQKEENNKEAMQRMFAVCLIGFIICENVYMNAVPGLIMYGIIGGRIFGCLGLFALVSMVYGVREELQEKKQSTFAEADRTENAEQSEGTGRSGYSFRKKILNHNFFIYAVHYLEIRAFQHGVSLIMLALTGMADPGQLLSILLYIAMPALCVVLSVIAGEIMRKKVPQVYGILTGGR